MKKQIIKRNDQGEVISVREYGIERSEILTCSKCHQPQDFLLGEEENMACEACYIASEKPLEGPNEAVMPVGDEDQVGQLRGTVPTRLTAEELLVSLGVKK